MRPYACIVGEEPVSKRSRELARFLGTTTGGHERRENRIVWRMGIKLGMSLLAAGGIGALHALAKPPANPCIREKGEEEMNRDWQGPPWRLINYFGR